MIIKSVPITTFTLEITTKFKPQENTELSGLYKSSGAFCTQCEAEGFRSITYYPDRPDVMSVFTTKITADKTKYPVLLSNGNLVETETSADGNAATRRRGRIRGANRVISSRSSPVTWPSSRIRSRR